MSDVVYFLCDGRDPECERLECYLNGGCCKHTNKLSHAKNFIYNQNSDEFGKFNGYYKEEPDNKNKTLLEIFEECPMEERRKIARLIYEATKPEK